MTQKYDKEFKLSAVKLYLSSQQSIERIASDLGVSRASLGKWISAYKRDGERSFPGSGHVVEEELRSLKAFQTQTLQISEEVFVKHKLGNFLIEQNAL